MRLCRCSHKSQLIHHMLRLPDSTRELPLTDASPSAALPVCCLHLPCLSLAPEGHHALHSIFLRSGCDGPCWQICCWAGLRAGQASCMGTLGGHWAPLGSPRAWSILAQGCWRSWNPCWRTAGLVRRGSGSINCIEMTLSECQHMKCVVILQPCHCLWLFFLCF